MSQSRDDPQTLIVLLLVAMAFKVVAKFSRAWVAHSLVMLAGTAKI
jgi:hypothetical protein